MTDATTTAGRTDREVVDAAGRVWHPVAMEVIAAHLKKGARLGFRPADAPGAEPVHTPVVFNSMEAAYLAIGTMSDKELRRRLQWAKTDAGIMD